jgi:hypothetical protein
MLDTTITKKYYAHVAIDPVPEAKHRNWHNEDWYVTAVNEQHAREKIAATAKRRNWWIFVVCISLEN